MGIGSFLRRFRCVTALSGALIGISCSSPSKTERQNAADPNRGYWIGHSVAGSPRMVINLSQQRLLYYKGGRLVGVSPISSGRESHATRTGTYRIIEKDIAHRSSLYGDFVTPSGAVVQRDVDVRKDARPPGTRFLGSNMRYFMRITGAIGMHEGYLPGYPASHGCIRLPSRMAAAFYHATPLGTPVQIVGNAPAARMQPPPVHELPPEPAPVVEVAAAQPQKEQRGGSSSGFKLWKRSESASAAGAPGSAQRPAVAGQKASPKPAATSSTSRLFGGRKPKAPAVPPGTTLYWNP